MIMLVVQVSRNLARCTLSRGLQTAVSTATGHSILVGTRARMLLTSRQAWEGRSLPMHGNTLSEPLTAY